MGTPKTAIWVALFALIANAGSGLGLELANPAAGAQGVTVCETQSVIATMLMPSTSSLAPDVCRLQLALDLTGNTEDTASDPASSPLFGAVFHDHMPTFDGATLGMGFIPCTLLDRPESDSTTPSLLNFALPPGSPPHGAIPPRVTHAQRTTCVRLRASRDEAR